ncbi:MAG: hypothetical protein MUF87_03715 [Anaerolineae bacterium]|jgi:Tol biopolymer transport system component|nr:hypothetical protein [Anaerolineae bacterium]
MRVFWVLAILWITGSLTQAQTTADHGVILGTVPAAHDRIIVYDLQTELRRELRFGEAWHHLWGFSPDGCRILFTLTGQNGLGRAYTARLDGRDRVELVSYSDLPPEQWGIWEPQWSPKDDKIVFRIARDGFEGEDERQYHIAWVDPAGGEPTFYSRSGDEHTPQWSPDGEWLVYVSYEERVAGADIYSTAEPTQEPPNNQPPAPMLREADLWIVSADGETRYRLTNFSTGNVSMPRWSPNSELIAFVYSPSPNNDTQWMIANQANALPTQLTFFWNLALDLTWTPDGAGILAVLRNFRDLPENRIWRLPLVGNGDSDATAYLGRDDLIYVDYPRFSLDGTMVAFRSSYQLTVLDAENGEVILVDETAPGNTPPIWGRDCQDS